MHGSTSSLAEPDACTATLRERKHRATRSALRRSAVALVASRGLAAVTVEDIAADADVSPRTFYNYFPSKEDAISGWDPAVVTDLVGQLRDRPADEPAPVALRAALVDLFSRFDADHRDLLERLQVIRSDPHLLAHHASRWAETERQLVATLTERHGPGSPVRYARLVVAVTLAASRVALMAWCDDEGSVPLTEELAVHLDVLGSGLTDPEWSSA